MKKLCISAMLLSLIAGCTNFDSRIEKKQLNDDFYRYTLNNGYIGVDIMPQLGGMVSGVRYCPEKRELFREQIITVQKDDLLPPFPIITGTGITDYLWGVSTKGKIPAKVRKLNDTPEEASIIMSDRFFRMMNCEWTKKVILKKNRTAFQVEMTFFNHSKKVIDVAIWQNVIQSLGKDQKWDVIVMPCKGQIRFVGRRGVKYFPEDTIFQECDPADREIFAAPSRPWIAARNELFPGVLALRTTEESAGSGALFYTYKAMTNHTMEFIGKSLPLHPKKSLTINFEYAFFPDMKNVSEVFGKETSIAIYARIDGKTLRFDWQNSGKAPAAEWEFFLSGSDGKKFSLGKKMIPELEPGEIFSAGLPMPENLSPGKYILSAASDNDVFSVSESYKIK